MLGFLKRNLEISSQETNTAAYITLVRPKLEYCASVCDPHHSQLVQKLEMVQRRAGRYTTRSYRNTSSVTNMLEGLNWESLQSRRTKIHLTVLLKIINNLVHVDILSDTYLTLHHQGPGLDQLTPRRCYSTTPGQTHSSLVSYRGPNLYGSISQHPLLRPRLGILQAAVVITLILNY